MFSGQCGNLAFQYLTPYLRTAVSERR